MNILFHNGDLQQDFEKIQSYDGEIFVSKEHEPVFNGSDDPYGIDVADNSYWYLNPYERDEDYQTLKNLLPQFTYLD